MSTYRIDNHPILSKDPYVKTIEFFWNGESFSAKSGEMISSALFAQGIRIFGHHPKDGSPQGIFCANGQCSQCMVLVNGQTMKACMTPVESGMQVKPLDGLPVLEGIGSTPSFSESETLEIPVLIIGGGPAGLSAAIQLGQNGVKTILIDDKDHLGGKLVLQTHKFFGSIEAVHAGTRGIDIARRLEEQVRAYDDVEIWLNSTALAVFSDQKIGILKDNQEYICIKPQILLNAAGAREKSLTFKGNTLPGVYGAGAFQTLVNRDLIKPSEKLFIVGGGNVGLIAGYHALQAGIDVVGLVEALPECGGYLVHKNKLMRMGVPIHTSHTILSANGNEQVESVTISEIDQQFQPIEGTERTFSCDTILIAVGLDSVNEFTQKARDYQIPVFTAGDAAEIAEASSAMFSGKISGMEIIKALGKTQEPIPEEWHSTAAILKSHPGETKPIIIPEVFEGVFPIFHCSQEIPCNPCTSVCPQELIFIDNSDIREIPQFLGFQAEKNCTGCLKCVAICPGLAISVVDFRKDTAMPTVTLAYEFEKESIQKGQQVVVMDTLGNPLGEVEVTHVQDIQRNDHTIMVKVKAPAQWAKKIAGIQVQKSWISQPLPEAIERLEDDSIVCRCEHVTAGEIRTLIQQGIKDMNTIKAVTRAGMGACGGKTCETLIQRLFREEGIPSAQTTQNTKRPLFIEVPMGTFAGKKEQ
ncbi:MAG: FAD-dependent oxidoreductase [Anaerolineaceae bacterium]|nr:FAD-dependent oxidoreductase [Anaerolineaceae bacterium]